MRLAIILLSMGLTASVITNVLLYRRAERFAGPKYEWSYDPVRNIVTSRLREGDLLLSADHDRDGDLNADSIVTYGRKGGTPSIWVDEDFNGLFEVQWAFNDQGQVVARYEDISQDGYFEDWTFYSADSISTYRDRNLDQRVGPGELIRSTAR